MGQCEVKMANSARSELFPTNIFYLEVYKVYGVDTCYQTQRSFKQTQVSQREADKCMCI